MAPYGMDPYKLPRKGTVGEYTWEALLGKKQGGAQDITIRVTGGGKTVAWDFHSHPTSLATMLGKLNNEPDEAEQYIQMALKNGKDVTPMKGGNEWYGGKSSNSGVSSAQDKYWNR